MVTSPKLMAPFHIDLGMVLSSRGACSQVARSGNAIVCLGRTRRLREDGAERVRREDPHAVRGNEHLVAELHPVVTAHLARRTAR